MLLAIGTCLFHAGWLARFRPYRSPALDNISLLSSAQLLITLIMGLAIKAQKLSEQQAFSSSHFDTTGFGIVMVALNLFNTLASAYMFAELLRRSQMLAADQLAENRQGD